MVENVTGVKDCKHVAKKFNLQQEDDSKQVAQEHNCDKKIQKQLLVKRAY